MCITNTFIASLTSEVDCTKFDYLGMVVDTKSGDEAELTMKSYIEEVVKEHSAEGFAATPAADDLFKVDDESRRLVKAAAERFHRGVAQL